MGRRATWIAAGTAQLVALAVSATPTRIARLASPAGPTTAATLGCHAAAAYAGQPAPVATALTRASAAARPASAARIAVAWRRAIRPIHCVQWARFVRRGSDSCLTWTRRPSALIRAARRTIQPSVEPNRRFVAGSVSALRIARRRRLRTPTTIAEVFVLTCARWGRRAARLT